MATRKKLTEILEPKQGRAVVVCTAKRGVFFGYLQLDEAPAKVVLTKARNCPYWSADVKGVMGLAAKGPTASCRIGPAAPDATLWEITGILSCSPEAVAAWEAAPWKI